MALLSIQEILIIKNYVFITSDMYFHCFFHCFICGTSYVFGPWELQLLTTFHSYSFMHRCTLFDVIINF